MIAPATRTGVPFFVTEQSLHPCCTSTAVHSFLFTENYLQQFMRAPEKNITKGGHVLRPRQDLVRTQEQEYALGNISVIGIDEKTNLRSAGDD